jgi:serine/threonine protein kinase
MIDQGPSDQDEPEDDSPELALCVVLDEYWEELQRKSDPDSRRRLSDRDVPDQAVAGDLEVLNLLHQLRQSALEVSDASQAPTVIVSEPFWPGLRSRAADLGRLKGSGGDPMSGPAPEVPASPTGAERAETVARPPRRIGKYLVVELLDEGGQAQVFRVLHPELGKEFVLKLARRPMRPAIDSAADPADRQGLLREGRLLAQCDHPNLVRVVDLDAHEGHLFVVMEHVAGLTLEQFTDQNRPGPRRAARLVAELARAVAYLHDRGIVHQDIKPKNVLVDDQGRPRLIDFGLARRKHAWSGDTVEGIGGTAAYMSPEQVLGRADRIGPWTDVFGLGGLLYHLLTRRPLYQGASGISVLRQAMKAEYVPVRQVNRTVPRALERICHKALAADPERRYRTAGALERALRRFLTRRWLAAAGLIVLSLIAVAPIAQRARAPRVTPSSNLPSAPAPLKINALRVEHFGSRDGSWQALGPICLSSRTILEGDDVRVSAELDAPAYCYLIALNPDGKVQLCLPPNDSEPPGQAAEIRFEESTYFPLTDGPGLQAFVVLASPRPLPAYAQWSGSGWLKRRWQHVAADDVDGVWRHDGRVPTLVSSVPRGPLRKRPGPPAPFDEACKYLAMLPEVETIQAIAFPVRPKESATEAPGHRGDNAKVVSQ